MLECRFPIVQVIRSGRAVQLGPFDVACLLDEGGSAPISSASGSVRRTGVVCPSPVQNPKQRTGPTAPP
jgi:hypothetical protein